MFCSLKKKMTCYNYGLHPQEQSLIDMYSVGVGRAWGADNSHGMCVRARVCVSVCICACIIESSGTTLSCLEDLNPENTFCPSSKRGQINTSAGKKFFFLPPFFLRLQGEILHLVCRTIYFSVYFCGAHRLSSPHSPGRATKKPQGNRPSLSWSCHWWHVSSSTLTTFSLSYPFFLVLGVSQSNMTHQWI